MAIADEAVKTYVRHDREGFGYISPACPEGISHWYAKLLSVGYANGWLA
jgi:hypothetical protein